MSIEQVGPEPFEVDVRNRGTTRTVTPRGDIDMLSAEVLRQRLVSALADGFETVVLDLGQTTFLDSTGIAMILKIVRRARERRVRLVLVPGPPHVQQVLELCGVGKFLNFSDAAGPGRADGRLA